MHTKKYTFQSHTQERFKNTHSMSIKDKSKVIAIRMNMMRSKQQRQYPVEHNLFTESFYS